MQNFGTNFNNHYVSLQLKTFFLDLARADIKKIELIEKVEPICNEPAHSLARFTYIPKRHWLCGLVKHG